MSAAFVGLLLHISTRYIRGRTLRILHLSAILPFSLGALAVIVMSAMYLLGDLPTGEYGPELDVAATLGLLGPCLAGNAAAWALVATIFVLFCFGNLQPAARR
jgi:hypothetical protein